MDDLNAQQIVLLTLLVSFVTSIATGIVTVSLLEQAPVPVSQTINRVVERTIEKVVTEPGEPGEKVIETVVVKEEDAIVEVINQNLKGVVRIYDVADGVKGNFIGLGAVVDSSGKVMASSKNIVAGTSYIGIYSGGEFELKIEPSESTGVVYLNPSKTEEATFSPVILSSDKAKLGQSIVLISGRLTNKVSTGIVTEVLESSDEEGNPKYDGFVTSIHTDNILNGSFILNLKGEVIGFSVDGLNTFAPSKSL